MDDEDREVLIHFEGWNQRHDECIEFDSPRLRPVLSEERQDTRVKITNRVQLLCWFGQRLVRDEGQLSGQTHRQTDV